MKTKIMPVSDLRRETSAVIRGIREEGDVVTITQYGRPAVVMIDYEQYQRLADTADEQGWPDGYFTATYGALADEPLARPEQGAHELRDALL